MCNKVNSVSLEFGDAKITFFRIQLQTEDVHKSLWHDHGYYEIHFCMKRPQEYIFSGRNILLKPGELLIIPPVTAHNSLSLEDAANVKVVSLAVTHRENDKLFYDVFTSALNTNALTPLTIPYDLQMKSDIFGQEKLYHSVLGVCKLKAAAADFVYLLFEHIIKDDDIAVCGKTEIQVLMDNLIIRPDVTLDEIAAATHYSKRHVSRLIKNQYGISLSRLRQRNQKEDPNAEE